MHKELAIHLLSFTKNLEKILTFTNKELGKMIL